ncbi:hypothetical protein JCM10450v2_008188 [Rhodotorula kratochvilovae]
MAYVLGTGLPPGVQPSSSSAGSPSPRKRQALADEFRTVTVNMAYSTLLKPNWYDIPHWGRITESYFLGPPVAVLDRIFSDPTLSLRDHLALAATCRTLRACYWTAPPPRSSPDEPPASALWAGLIALRPVPLNGADVPAQPCGERERRAVLRIFSGGARVDAETFEVIGKADERGVGGSGSDEKKRAAPGGGWEGMAIRSYEWERAILLVQTSKITKTDAKKHYKLTDKDLKYLKAVVKRNPHAPRSGAPTNLFVESAVESLALRLHGGVEGHKALLAKRAASAAKAAATRAANGTKSGRPRGGRSGKKGKLSALEREILALAEGGEIEELYAEMAECGGYDPYGGYGE